MKRLFGELLGSHYRVRTNPRSYNTEIGLPLAVLNLEIDTRSLWNVLRTLAQAAWTAFCSNEKLEVLVLELGVRQAGDMRQLLRTVRPDIAVLTTLTPSYSTDVDVLRTLQDEVKDLCQAVGARCRFLVEDEDLLLREVVQTLPVPPVSLGLARWATNGQGLTLQSNGHLYHVTRELIGDSERVSVQAAVLLAERWTKLTRGEISRFLAGEAEPVERQTGG
jgi:UDP-N-acetylmuramyl pentapeptide synthase